MGHVLEREEGIETPVKHSRSPQFAQRVSRLLHLRWATKKRKCRPVKRVSVPGNWHGNSPLAASSSKKRKVPGKKTVDDFRPRN